ncbi:MAG: EF-hand domain-containing protein [Planctomycetes bacterium]|nr:EF-hand domain-containing protein [Planctomycetota bacterium]
METPSSAAPPGARSLARWAIVAVFGAALYVGWCLLWHMADDAYITYRYLSNAIAGRGLVWNPAPFLPVDGNTDFLWSMLLLTIWWAAGIEPPAIANWLALGFGTVVYLLVAREVWRQSLPSDHERWRPLLLALVLALLVSNRAWLASLSSGLGVSIFNCLVFVWVLTALSPRTRDEPRRWFVLAALAAACGLGRPEGHLATAATAVLLLAWGATGRQLPRGLAAAAVAVLPVAGHLVFRRLYYGDWLPCTYHAKNIGAWPASGARYFASFAVEFGVYVWLGAALAWLARRALRPGPLALLRREHLGGAAVAAVLLAHFGYYTLQMGGDLFEWRAYSHLVPLLPLLLLRLARSLAWRPRTLLAVLAAWFVCGLPIGWIKFAHQDRDVAPHVPALLQPLLRPYDDWQRWLSDRLVCKRNHEMKVNLAVFERSAPPRSVGARVPWDGFPVLAAEAVGVVGWALPNVAIVDLHGLNDAVIARNPVPTNAERLQHRIGELERVFGFFDQDHDDRVTPDEFRPWLAALEPDLAAQPEALEQRVRMQLLGFDLDGDRVVTRQEYVAANRPHGDRFMAHERLPPPGYVEGFRPNVVPTDDGVSVTPREPPLTAEQIRAHEREWRRRFGAAD